MARRISEPRKTAFYVGTGMAVIGGLLFLSVFITALANFGNFDDFENRGKAMGLRAVSGLILIVIGKFVRTLGARGAAGAGMILDPEQARDDLEPFSRQAGGMLKDALQEADVDLSRREIQQKEVVKIRCTACRALNEESAKFCDQCGQRL